MPHMPPPRRKRTHRRIAALPAQIVPMLAKPSEHLPGDQKNFAFEWKWDGVRALAFIERKKLRLQSRNLLDMTLQYPELQELPAALRRRSALLDGEIIAVDDLNRPSFARLQRRMHISKPAVALRLAGEIPAWYVVFDLLYTDGLSLLHRPYHERREQLANALVDGAHWRVTTSHVGEGTAMLAAARKSSLEGIVAKRVDSLYEPGGRTGDWLKIKIVHGQEFVIGGYTAERTARARRIGSLLLGYYDPAGKLQYAGRVGSGLSDEDHPLLLTRLATHIRASSPFAIDPAALIPGRWGRAVESVTYVNPVIVAEVEYRRWPAGGLVQQGAFKGVRFDKNPRLVMKELTFGDNNAR